MSNLKFLPSSQTGGVYRASIFYQYVCLSAHLSVNCLYLSEKKKKSKKKKENKILL